MTCHQSQKLIQAHHDGELDVSATVQTEEHLADCPTCMQTMRDLSALRAALQQESLRYSAPAGLRQRLRHQATEVVQSEQQAPPPRRRHLVASGAAAAILIAALAGGMLFRGPSSEDLLLAELTSSHVRSLMADHLTDVTSTDQHTVKPWFDGKLAFAPAVHDLRESGFPLAGGRLDFVGERPVAALVYHRRKHAINVFIWPASSRQSNTPRTSDRNGYHVVRWSTGDMSLAAVSDLNQPELMEFVHAYSNQTVD